MKFLWVQGALQAGRFTLYKELGDSNFGDLMAKHLPEEKMRRLLTGAGYEFRPGRAAGAPRLADGAAKTRLGAVVLGLGS